jgi:hypothetical protein
MAQHFPQSHNHAVNNAEFAVATLHVHDVQAEQFPPKSFSRADGSGDSALTLRTGHTFNFRATDSAGRAHAWSECVSGAYGDRPFEPAFDFKGT